ncbi:uncharacterized protein OCT59_014902 [Rhizophagus irregularis]|uniref:uncharacterized protein n=1 Tax=Rhizophagus irregularis TaxID=588596 RepID=UPI003318131D|nr:hypothetical protein OCT59_014902 [Rhizophagus irregularis]
MFSFTGAGSPQLELDIYSKKKLWEDFIVAPISYEVAQFAIKDVITQMGAKNRSRAFYQCQKLAKIQASDEEYSEEYSEEELGLDLFGGGIVRG